MSGNKTNLPKSYMQDVKRVVDVISQDEKQDEAQFRDLHKEYLFKKVEKALPSQPIKAPSQPPKGHNVPLWMFLLVGFWALVTSSTLAFIVGGNFLANENIPSALDQPEQPTQVEGNID